MFSRTDTDVGMHRPRRVIKGKVEEINLPEKVDVIISEWMVRFISLRGSSTRNTLLIHVNLGRATASCTNACSTRSCTPATSTSNRTA